MIHWNLQVCKNERSSDLVKDLSQWRFDLKLGSQEFCRNRIWEFWQLTGREKDRQKDRLFTNTKIVLIRPRKFQWKIILESLSTKGVV